MKIGIFNLSSPLSPEKLLSGLEWLRSHSFETKVIGDPSLYYGSSTGIFACGPIDARLQTIHDLCTDTECSLFLAARGGHGSVEISPELHSYPLASHKTPICGFSDSSSLLLSLRSLGRVQGLFHGPSLLSLAVGNAQNDFLKLCSQLSGKDTGSAPIIPNSDLYNEHNNEQLYKGELIASNLTVLASLCGTRFIPQISGPVILCVEEVGEEPYRVHRSLLQLHLSGFLRSVQAVILGEFKDCTSKHGQPPDVQSVINMFFHSLSIPVFHTESFGHGKRNCALPIGATVQLSQKEGLTLS